MKTHSPLSIILTTLLVVAFGWGVAFLVTRGIEAMRPSVITVETTTDQKALTLSANIVNPAVPAQVKSTHELTVLVGGDIMFDRGIRALGDKNGYDSLFDNNLVTLFKRADIVAANLEGPITSYPSKTLVGGKIVTDNLTFTFPPRVRTTLKDSGITIVSQANNHADNFGYLGTMETQDWLEDAGVAWFGNPWNSTSTKMSRINSIGQTPLATIMSKNGIRVAFVGYHAFQPGFERVLSEIRRVATPDTFVIVVPHWGEEYIATSSDRMKSQARAFMTAGADAIIGAHPHVIMDQEWVDGVPVFYSVGNLLFDQYFSPHVMTGNVIELHIVQDDTGIHLANTTTHTIQLVKGMGTKLVE